MTYTTEIHVYRTSAETRPIYVVYSADYTKCLFSSSDYWSVKAYASHYRAYIRCHFHRYSYAQGAAAACGGYSKYHTPESTAGALSTGRGRSLPSESEGIEFDLTSFH